MNRLHHLKQTLATNIIDNEHYEALEFVLLDYNSTDGLSEYISENFEKYLGNGRLIYYKTCTPKYFNRSHSRNLVFRLASGDLICNIDADNYTGKGFATYINNEFKKRESIFLTPLGTLGTNNKKDVLGRICLKKKDFYNIRGYDERMINYGFEDNDFANRLEVSGLTRMPISGNGEYLKAISHDERERLSNESVLGNLSALFVNYLTPSSTEFLFLFADMKFKRGTLIDNMTFQYVRPMTDFKKSQLKYSYSIFEDTWISGIWNENENELILKEDHNITTNFIFDEEKSCLTFCSDAINQRFYRLSAPGLIQDAVMFFSQITNRMIMDKNKLDKEVVVNPSEFGIDVVYKNFGAEPVIQLSKYTPF